MSANGTDADPLLTVTEVAELLTISKSTVSRLCKDGEFAPPYRVGNLLRWRKSAVLNWLETRQDPQGNKDV